MEPGLQNCQADSSTTDLIKRRLSLPALKRSFQEMLPQQSLMPPSGGGATKMKTSPVPRGSGGASGWGV